MATPVQCKITSSDLNRLIELELELAKCKHCNQIYKTSLGQTKTSLVCTEVVVAVVELVELVEVVEVVGTQCTVNNCCSVRCTKHNQYCRHCLPAEVIPD